MKIYGGFIAAQHRWWLILNKTAIMATTFAAENDEEAIYFATKMASKIFASEEGWYNQRSNVTSFSDATLDSIAQQIGAALYDERIRLEREEAEHTPTQDT